MDNHRYELAMAMDERTCIHCGNTLIVSNDYEEPMWEHTETGSIYCWDDSDVFGEPEPLEINT